MNEKKGPLILIGGSEELEGDCAILREIALAAEGPRRKLAIVTAATLEPAAVAAIYSRSFRSLGVHHITILDVRDRRDAYSHDNLSKLENASAVFFTGGDQSRIICRVANSPVFEKIRNLHLQGAAVAGTSAGAAAMPEVIIVSGRGKRSETACNTKMAPGLGLLGGVVVDSHFAQRGRICRLLGAIARYPKYLGIGIDENTAVVVAGNSLRVIGCGGVYVLDGNDVTYSSFLENEPEEVITLFNVRLHVMSGGDRYELARRRPLPGK